VIGSNRLLWIALARSAWLGEWTAEKGVSSFTRSAAIPPDVPPHVGAAAAQYIPEAREHLCDLLHGRAEQAANVAERLALFAAISQVSAAS
jgi:hypothetical protein